MTRGTNETARAHNARARKEAVVLVKRAAGTPEPGETTKARIRRTALLLGWGVNRTREIWRGSARRIDSHEMDQLRAISPAIAAENSDSS